MRCFEETWITIDLQELICQSQILLMFTWQRNQRLKINQGWWEDLATKVFFNKITKWKGLKITPTKHSNPTFSCTWCIPCQIFNAAPRWCVSCKSHHANYDRKVLMITYGINILACDDSRSKVSSCHNGITKTSTLTGIKAMFPHSSSAPRWARGWHAKNVCEIPW